MLRWAILFFLISLVAAAFGFTDVAAASAGIAKFLFAVFLVLAIGFLVAAAAVGQRVRGWFRHSS